MIRSCLRAAAAALLVMLALAGCSPQDRPLATVAGKPITVRDFERAVRAGGMNLAMMPPDQGKAMLLEQLVDRALLREQFHAQGLDTTAIFRNFRASITDQALLAGLSTQIAALDVGVSEAEARQLFEWRRTQSDVEVIWAPDSTLARRCREQVLGGMPWNQVADQFAGQGGLPPGGALGPRRPGELPEPLDTAMRTLRVGEVGGPYHAPQGWFLVRVRSRMPAAPETFEAQRAPLEQLLRQRKWQATLMEHVADLEPEYHITIAPEAAQVIALKLSPARMGDTLTAPTPAERAQVLITWDGGGYTLGDAWDDLQKPGTQRPAAAFTSSIRAWLHERSLTRVALEEARRRHLDEDPAVADRVRQQLDDYMEKTILGQVAGRTPAPDEAQLRAAWEQVRDRFPQLQQAHLAWVTVADSAQAAAIARQAAAGSLAAAAAASGARVQEGTVRFPNETVEWGPQQQLIESLPKGGCSPATATTEGWRVFQVLDKVQGPIDWEHLGPELRQLLANNLAQRDRQQAFTAYTDSLRHVVQVVTLAENLKRAPWVSMGGTTP